LRRALPVAGALILLVAPFGEGGRAPWALALLHTLALACVLAAIAWRREDWTIPGPPAPAGMTALLIVSLLLALASARRAAYPFAAGLALWDLAITAGLFLAAASVGNGEGDLLLLRNVAVASTSLQAILALARFAHGGPMAAGRGFLNPNHLAAFLNIGLLLGAAAAEEALRAGRRLRSLLWAGLAGGHATVVALLASRGAFAGLAAALLLLLTLRWRTWSRRVRVAAAISIIVLVAGGAALLERRFAHDEDPYRYHRLPIWRASLRMLSERPLLGFGPGMFRHESARYNFPLEEGPVRFGRTFASAHSGFLTLAVEDGTPAAAGLLGAAILTIALLVRSAPGRKEEALGVALVLAALLVHGLVDDLQERPALTLGAALLAGSALGATRQGHRAPGAPRGPRLRSALIVMAALDLFVGAILLPYKADLDARAALRRGREGGFLMERAARLNPLQPEYHQDLAMMALNSAPLAPESYARAARHLLEARRLKPIDYRFPLLLGRLEAEVAPRLFEDAGAQERARRYYLEAVSRAPLDPRPLLEMAGFLAHVGRSEEALAASREALRIEPNFVRARLMEISSLLALQRAGEARACFARMEETLRLLGGFHPDSGYARDIVADKPGERERLAAALSRAAIGDRGAAAAPRPGPPG
jgi:O-antigen ligase